MVDYISEDGMFNVKNESVVVLLSECLCFSGQSIVVVVQCLIYDIVCYLVGKLNMLSVIIMLQIVVVEYYLWFLVDGLINSYINNECLIWIKLILYQVR